MSGQDVVVRFIEYILVLVFFLLFGFVFGAYWHWFRYAVT